MGIDRRIMKQNLYLWNVYEDNKYFTHNAVGYDQESAMNEFVTRVKPKNINKYSFKQYRKLGNKEIEQYARYSKWLTDYLSNNQ